MTPLGFEGRSTALATRYNIPLTICGEANRNAPSDLVLVHRPTMVLLVLVEDKMLSNPMDAEAQVIAEVIATNKRNNFKREGRALGRLERMTIPCITMSGTRPAFYLVSITEALSFAVMAGLYPQQGC